MRSEPNLLTFLFNPRTDIWQDHFILEGTLILPLTAVGRVTVRVLDLNSAERVEVRQMLIEDGRYL